MAAVKKRKVVKDHLYENVFVAFGNAGASSKPILVASTARSARRMVGDTSDTVVVREFVYGDEYSRIRHKLQMAMAESRLLRRKLRMIEQALDLTLEDIE